MSAEEITAERRKTHGSWIEQANVASTIKRDLRAATGWHGLPPWRQEALDMIAVKLSRVVVGNADEPDHWDDIGGYAHLGKAGHK